MTWANEAISCPEKKSHRHVPIRWSHGRTAKEPHLPSSLLPIAPCRTWVPCNFVCIGSFHVLPKNNATIKSDGSKNWFPQKKGKNDLPAVIQGLSNLQAMYVYINTYTCTCVYTLGWCFCSCCRNSWQKDVFLNQKKYRTPSHSKLGLHKT